MKARIFTVSWYIVPGIERFLHTVSGYIGPGIESLSEVSMPTSAVTNTTEEEEEKCFGAKPERKSDRPGLVCGQTPEQNGALFYFRI